MQSLRLVDVHRGADQIVARCALDDLRFHVTVWYEDVDLAALARRFGDEALERIAVHIALFQLNAACSLRLQTRRWCTLFHVDCARGQHRGLGSAGRYQ